MGLGVGLGVGLGMGLGVGAFLGMLLRDGMQPAPGPLQACSWTWPYSASSASAVDHWSLGSGHVAGSAPTNVAPCRRGRPVGSWRVGSA
jgi:hypothetical protein